jgi:hypothetical protein
VHKGKKLQNEVLRGQKTVKLVQTLRRLNCEEKEEEKEKKEDVCSQMLLCKEKKYQTHMELILPDYRMGVDWCFC